MSRRVIKLILIPIYLTLAVYLLNHVSVTDRPTPMVNQSDGSDVIMLGDSITELTTPVLLEQLPNAYIDGISSTFFKKDCSRGESGLTRLRELVQAGTMRDVLVFAFGTNSDFSDESQLASYVNELVSLAGSDTQIVLMTYYALDYDYSRWSEAIRNEAAKYENVTVADWETCMDRVPDPTDYIKHEVGNRDVHPTPAGQELFAGVIVDSVNAVTHMQVEVK